MLLACFIAEASFQSIFAYHNRPDTKKQSNLLLVRGLLAPDLERLAQRRARVDKMLKKRRFFLWKMYEKPLVFPVQTLVFWAVLWYNYGV